MKFTLLIRNINRVKFMKKNPKIQNKKISIMKSECRNLLSTLRKSKFETPGRQKINIEIVVIKIKLKKI